MQYNGIEWVEIAKNGQDGLSVEHKDVVEDVLKRLPEPKNGINGKDGRDGSPDKPKEIASKLNTLEDKVEPKVIKGLKERFDALKLEIGQVRKRTGGSGGGSSVRAQDLSGSLDGATKTFTIPRTTRVVSVHSSSFPNSFRETVDFTWTKTSITFTSEIDAATTLAAGQTITVIYVEG